MTDVTREQLDLLLDLQVTDSGVRRIQHQLDDLPEQRQLDAALVRVDELGRVHADTQVELDRALAEQRQLERETEVLTQRRDAERSRLYDGTVHNAREMKAVEAEIETTGRRIAEHDDLLLESMERADLLGAQSDALLGERDAEQQSAEELALARDAAAKSLLVELAELRARRDQQAAQLPAELLGRYEEIAARAGGTGVGTLEDDACTACRLRLSKVDVGELYAGPPLTTCPHCRRLLVVPA